jgi:hypothetical protein
MRLLRSDSAAAPIPDNVQGVALMEFPFLAGDPLAYTMMTIKNY